MEKLRQRGIVARLFYGAGLRKLENDYLNPKHGDVLASQRRYRRYLAGDKRIVAEASWAAWGPLMVAVVTPALFGVTALVLLAHHALAPYAAVVDQKILELAGRHSIPTVAPAATPQGSSQNQMQPNVATGSTNEPVSNAMPLTRQSDVEVPPATSATDANNAGTGDTQDSEIGQDLSMKLQALLAQGEQQFDTGQYQNAAATTEAILEIEPDNVSARRLHAAALRNVDTVAAADATEARGVSPSLPGPVAHSVPFSTRGPSGPPIAVYGNSPYGRHVGGK
ncbi:hypothetical protein [Paraburkholderia sp. BL21I4N1]|uniref:hypothetical protein n=1 Tax=Paraburkholderia sp. BL21I4N1 TaxID=1938801 RepID=UPI0011B21848|nr:hypothetical protein [Paraburkholderia sp. BL21I4N1]